MTSRAQWLRSRPGVGGKNMFYLSKRACVRWETTVTSNEYQPCPRNKLVININDWSYVQPDRQTR
ncbi:unnamed protein product [Larinioides sclopetarius]|uniref:Uncharacterized protein n=1 Tax=Larinioides sclopetarius TaxID=280406 RepID=A0AAV2AMD1_9ARAC